MRYNDEKEPIVVYMDYKGKNRKPQAFYCCKCGKMVCEITGDARTIIPGQPDQEDMNKINGKVIIKCNGMIYLGSHDRMKCTAKYIFN